MRCDGIAPLNVAASASREICATADRNNEIADPLRSHMTYAGAEVAKKALLLGATVVNMSTCPAFAGDSRGKDG